MISLTLNVINVPQGKPVVLKYVKFQNVRRYFKFIPINILLCFLLTFQVEVSHYTCISLTIFIEDNQSDSEITRVQKIGLCGTT